MGDQTTRLLRNGLAGNQDDYSVFIANINPWLLAVATRCGAAIIKRGIDPEDIVQDVWASCLPRLGELTPQEGRITPVVMKYLSVAVRRKVGDLMVAAANSERANSHDLLSSLTADRSGIITQIAARERGGQVTLAIEALAQPDRDALLLLSIEQVSLDEAAQVLGITKDAAKQRHHRARERLRAQLPDSLIHELD